MTPRSELGRLAKALDGYGNACICVRVAQEDEDRTALQCSVAEADRHRKNLVERVRKLIKAAERRGSLRKEGGSR